MPAIIKKIIPYLKYLLLIIILIFFFLFIKNNPAVFKKLLEIDFFTLFLVSILTILHFSLSSLLLYYLLKIINTEINFFDTFRLNLISFLLNLLLIKTGTVIKGVYLKKNYGLSIKNYIKLSGVIGMGSLFIASFFIVIISGYSIFFNHPEYISRFLIYTGFSFILFLIIYFYLKTSIKKHFTFIVNSKKTLLAIFLFSAILILVQGLKLYIIYRHVFCPIDYFSTVFMSSFGSWTQIISLTPGALGIREGAMAFAATILEKNLAISAAVLSLDRAIEIFWMLAIGTYSYFSLLKSHAKN
jgi:uncharacterized membrane protein YbhN (UPF0104 family)